VSSGANAASMVPPRIVGEPFGEASCIESDCIVTPVRG
jgi:hypothetical protein